MKIGILTFQRVANYGAILQAYALFNVLKMTGHDVELIDYSTDRTCNLIQKHLYSNPYFAFNAVKEWRMNNFSRKYMKLTARKYRTSEELKKYAQNFDLIICGSDEIWNIQLPFQNYDFNYFLDFATPNVSKISYAASFGYTSSDNIGENIVRISQLLQSFSAISVRDENSLQLVRSCKISAVKVLDPTFLCEYSKILSLPVVKRKYLLIYAHLSREEQSYAKKIATYLGLDLVAIGYPCRIADYNHLAVSPAEWLGYFAEAAYVISDFYHGVIFSIIFKKPFSTFVRDPKSNKIGDILRELNAEDRILSPLQMSLDLKDLELKIDLNLMKINLDYPKLEQMVHDSNQYLDRALSVAANTQEIKQT
jgi:hypothetical protein